MSETPSDSQARVAFRYPNFRYFMIARFLVVVSTEMQAVAVAWQIYDKELNPTADGGRADALPAWSLATAFPNPDGSFTIVY